MNKELEFPPGSHWKYSSGTSNLLARLLHDRVGGDGGSRTWIEAKLFGALGISTAFIEADPLAFWLAQATCMPRLKIGLSLASS